MKFTAGKYKYEISGPWFCELDDVPFSRKIERKQIKQVFQGKRTTVDCHYPTMPSPLQDIFEVKATAMRLRIGCRVFSGKTFAAIKKWAELWRKRDDTNKRTNQ